MNKNILNFINLCEKWKVEIKGLHWDSNNLSQHNLCDDIASEISDFEDLVSEVEQSISGKLPKGSIAPKKATSISLKPFVEEVISESQKFLKKLEGMGEKYIGVKSECETFIGTMQRKLYLVNFTLKEELKNRIRDKINEARPKNLANVDDVEKFIGRRPKTMKSRINHIYKIVKKYGIDSRLYHDEHWQAIDDYYTAISSLGCEVEMKPCANLNNADSIESDGGYGDYDEHDHMPRSKQYAIKIVFDDGMAIDGYIKCMAAGTVSDPFSAYDTCMVLWPKTNKVLESKNNMKKQLRLNENELKTFLRESVKRTLASLREMNELYQEWYNEEDYNGNVGEEGMVRSYDIGGYYIGQAEQDAMENGYDDVAEYLEYWFDEIQAECPWYWQKVGNGYGYNGTTIFQNDGIVCKDIYGQIIIDEYPIGDARRNVQNESKGKIRTLNETPLNYDIDNFSGRWTKSEPSDEEWALADSAANGDYLDNPFNPPNSWDDDEWIDGDKDMENDYSWDLYHRMNNVGKSPVDRQHDIMDAAQNRRDHAAYWTDRDNERGNRLMSKWVDGKRDLDDLEDADFSYDPYKYNESKNPTKTINEIGDTSKGRKMLARLAGKRMAQGATLAQNLRKNGIEGGDDMVANKFNGSLNASHYAEDALDREIRKALDKFDLGEEDEKKIKSIIKNSENKRMQNDYQDEFYGYGESAYRTNESKSLKLSESELKAVVKEAAISLIQEYTKKQMGKEVDESIDIDPKNKGKFTATKKATGKSTEELCHSKNPLTRKRANFAKMAKRHWKPLK